MTQNMTGEIWYANSVHKGMEGSPPFHRNHRLLYNLTYYYLNSTLKFHLFIETSFYAGCSLKRKQNARQPRPEACRSRHRRRTHTSHSGGLLSGDLQDQEGDPADSGVLDRPLTKASPEHHGNMVLFFTSQIFSKVNHGSTATNHP